MIDKLLLAGGVGFASGILCRSFYSYGIYEMLFVGVLALVLLCAYWFHGALLYKGACIFVIGFVCGSLRMTYAPHALPAEFVSYIGSDVSLAGTVDALPDVRETSQRITVRVRGEDKYARVLAVVPRAERFEYGDPVVVSGTLLLPEPFATEGGRTFDYPAFLAKDEIFSIIENGAIEKSNEDVALYAYPLRTLFRVREYLVEGVARALPEPAAALGTGMLIGGKQGLGRELLEAFTVSGLLPIVVLSGYNVMIVAEIVLRVLRGVPRRLSMSIATGVILLFVLSSGAGSAAVRAGLMASIGLFARATGRTYAAVRALLVVSVAMVLINPYLLAHDPGFQFSVVATLGLILGSPIASRYLLWIRSGMFREVVASTIAAQVFVLPLLLYHVGILSLVSVPANIIVLPLVPLSMLATFVAGVAGVVVPALAPFVGLPAYGLLSFIVWVASTFSELPLSAYTIPTFSFGMVIVAYALLSVVVRRIQKQSLTRKLV